MKDLGTILEAIGLGIFAGLGFLFVVMLTIEVAKW